MKFILLTCTAITSFCFSAMGQSWTSTSLEFTSPGTSYTKFQLAEHVWSGSHAILFNAYKNVSVNGSLYTTGNTRYANDVGSYSGGAAGIFVSGNGGNMRFYISPSSTGKDTDVNWGTPKMVIERGGNIGIGTTTTDAKLTISNNDYDKTTLSIDNTNANFSFSDHTLSLNSKPSWAQVPYIQWTAPNGNRQAYMGWEPNYFNLTLENGYNFSINGGSVGIGTTTTGTHKLAVEGSIGARAVKIEATGWSDFVFDDDYELQTLDEVEKYISKNKHLPEIPSEAEVLENGIDVGKMDAKLLQKIEELMLYMIEINKEVKGLKLENQDLKSKVSILESK